MGKLQEKANLGANANNENIIKDIYPFLNNPNAKTDVYLNNEGIRFFIKNKVFQKTLIGDGLRTGLRCIVEMTADNIGYCKKLASLVNDVRHTSNIIGTIVLDDKAFVFLNISKTEKPTVLKIINKNSKTKLFIEQP